MPSTCFGVPYLSFIVKDETISYNKWMQPTREKEILKKKPRHDRLGTIINREMCNDAGSII